MSEQLRHQESSHNNESLVSQEVIARNQELVAERARKAIEKNTEQDKSALAEEVRKHASEARKNKIEAGQSETRDDLSLPGVQQSMKNRTYKRELAKIQTKLSKPQRTFSKIIHNKTVESVSNASAQTIARPSGLLGGSIFAFVGSLATYYMARHYGFRYNYLVLFLLFLVGFAAGAIIELLVWTLKRKQRTYR